MELKIDSEIESLFKTIEPPKELEEDIKAKRKIEVPLVVTQDGTILDGIHRFKIVKKYQITEIPFNVRQCKDREEMLQIAVDLNTKRRHLNNFSRAIIAVKFWLPRFEGRVGKQLDAKAAISGKSAELAGGKVKLSRDTVQRMQTVLKKASKKEIEAGIKGEEMGGRVVTVSGLYQKYKPKKSIMQKSLGISYPVSVICPKCGQAIRVNCDGKGKHSFRP